MWPRILLLAGALLFASAAAPGLEAVTSAQAIQPGWMVPVQDRRGDQQANILSLREVVSIVQSRRGGELLSARLERGQQPVYVLRWRLPNNEVTDIRVDAVSGQIR